MPRPFGKCAIKAPHLCRDNAAKLCRAVGSRTVGFNGNATTLKKTFPFLGKIAKRGCEKTFIILRFLRISLKL